jgi:hypothetical protein
LEDLRPQIVGHVMASGSAWPTLAGNRVIAEGVEKAEHLFSGQGYAFQKSRLQATIGEV